MASKRNREFQCEVVSEAVRIYLKRKPTAGIQSKHVYFVQCDQGECQYVDANEPPCPLSPSMFAEEIRDREEESRARREGY